MLCPRLGSHVQRMGAYRCVLTHFSQRYPKWPEGLPQPAPPKPDGEEGHGEGSGARGSAFTAAVAFDGMRVPLALLPVLPALMPAVRAALEDAEEEPAGAQLAAEAQGLLPDL